MPPSAVLTVPKARYEKSHRSDSMDFCPFELSFFCQFSLAFLCFLERGGICGGRLNWVTREQKFKSKKHRSSVYWLVQRGDPVLGTLVIDFWKRLRALWLQNNAFSRRGVGSCLGLKRVSPSGSDCPFPKGLLLPSPASIEN